MHFAVALFTTLVATTSKAQSLENTTTASSSETAPIANTPDGAKAHAESPPFIFSLRPSVGVGAGDLGIGGRVGAASEYWIADQVGLGLAGAYVGATRIFGSSGSAATIMPVVAFRSNMGSEYFIGTLGAGYAQVKHTDSEGLCLDLFGDGSSCRPDIVTHYAGYAIDAAVGWLAHPGGSPFEIGPVLRFDAVGDFTGKAQMVATLNLELGFALRSPDQPGARLALAR